MKLSVLTYIEKVYALILLVFNPILRVPAPDEQNRPDESAGVANSWYWNFACSLYRYSREILTIKREEVIPDRFPDETSKNKKVAGLRRYGR